MSELKKLREENEVELQATYAAILAESDPDRIDYLTQRLNHLAHERRLTIKFQAIAMMKFPADIVGLVIDGVPTESESEGSNG